jgi:hypothetical protein
MAGAGLDHNLIVTNLVALLKPLARAKGCRVYSETVKLKLSEDTFYYPDVMVVCGPKAHPLYETAPCLVVEVLSPSTEAQDRREKLARYLRLPSLEGYLLLQSETRGGTLYRRTPEGFREEALGEVLHLPAWKALYPWRPSTRAWRETHSGAFPRRVPRRGLPQGPDRPLGLRPRGPGLRRDDRPSQGPAGGFGQGVARERVPTGGGLPQQGRERQVPLHPPGREEDRGPSTCPTGTARRSASPAWWAAPPGAPSAPPGPWALGGT